MRCILLALFALPALCAAPARAEDIVEVLQRSQQMRLDAMPRAAPDSDAAHTLQSVFDQLVQVAGIDQPVELRVIEGESLAETLLGHVVIANVALARRPQAEQLFILAHELGHVVQGHQDQMGQLYRKWVPGAVVQEHTDAVAPMLGREASGLAHRQEYAADAFALRTLCAMGYSRNEVVELFMRMGLFQATATHPASNKRMSALRMTPLDEPPSETAALAQVR
jgi:predicted Zn-dependent protease